MVRFSVFRSNAQKARSWTSGTTGTTGGAATSDETVPSHGHGLPPTSRRTQSNNSVNRSQRRRGGGRLTPTDYQEDGSSSAYPMEEQDSVSGIFTTDGTLMSESVAGSRRAYPPRGVVDDDDDDNEDLVPHLLLPQSPASANSESQSTFLADLVALTTNRNSVPPPGPPNMTSLPVPRGAAQAFRPVRPPTTAPAVTPQTDMSLDLGDEHQSVLSGILDDGDSFVRGVSADRAMNGFVHRQLSFPSSLEESTLGDSVANQTNTGGSALSSYNHHQVAHQAPTTSHHHHPNILLSNSNLSASCDYSITSSILMGTATSLNHTANASTANSISNPRGAAPSLLGLPDADTSTSSAISQVQQQDSSFVSRHRLLRRLLPRGHSGHGHNTSRDSVPIRDLDPTEEITTPTRLWCRLDFWVGITVLVLSLAIGVAVGSAIILQDANKAEDASATGTSLGDQDLTTFVTTDTPTIAPVSTLQTRGESVQVTKNPTLAPMAPELELKRPDEVEVATTNDTDPPPTMSPVAEPTTAPTNSPVETTAEEQNLLTDGPTVGPTSGPTSVAPTGRKTNTPTPAPTLPPTESPTKAPSGIPTVRPTRSPTTSPTVAPTVAPTDDPTTTPSWAPTVPPSRTPTRTPSRRPTNFPTTGLPSQDPTVKPSATPTAGPVGRRVRQMLEQVAPASTLEALQDPTSVQSETLEWVETNPFHESMPVWQQLQRFALAVYLFTTIRAQEDADENVRRLQRGWVQQDLPECEWAGIDCDSNGRVTSIDVSSLQLAGQLPVEFVLLAPTLQILNFDDNQLTGTIPVEYGALGALTHFRMARNQIQGPVPETLANLANLVSWHAQDNRLSGDFPNDVVAFLASVRSIRLSGNLLGGSVSHEVCDRNFQVFVVDCAHVISGTPCASACVSS